ncbi:MAG: glycosyltransferase family 2 protein [Candidatus Sumerlaeota bacterium]|nr:glycosyltransferase family 2 protein [Candidatus Sumerlaeota bacterium]
MSQTSAKSDSQPPFLSVVIPAYNEERRIGATLQAIGAYLDKQTFSSEIVVVDDGSRDQTATVARRARPKARLLTNEINHGKGYTVRRGVSEARGEIILFSDADLSTPIEEFDGFLHHFKEGADIVIGSRALPQSRIERHQGRLRETAGRIFNQLLRFAAGLPFHDTQCGFKAFRRPVAREVFARQRVEGWGFDAELIVIAMKRGYRIDEVPVRWVNSPDSRLRIWRDAPRMFLDLLRIRWNDWRGRYR